MHLVTAMNEWQFNLPKATGEIINAKICYVKVTFNKTAQSLPSGKVLFSFKLIFNENQIKLLWHGWHIHKMAWVEISQITTS